jgi:hypothetical protein
MATPNVIVGIDYHGVYTDKKLPNFDNAKSIDNWLKLKKKSEFVRGNQKNGNLFNYLTRPNAASKNDIKTIKAIEYKAEYTDTSEKDILNYASNRPGSTGAFDAQGDINTEKGKSIRAELQTTKSIVWTTIISFERQYGDKFCRNKNDAKVLLEAALKRLFAKSHLKYENINWYAAMHTNTDNKHIHLVFWEKQPIYTKKNSTALQYAQRGKLSQDAINDFKFSIANYFEHKKLDYYTMRDNLRNSLKSSLQNGYYQAELSSLSAQIINAHIYQYAKLPADLQNKIKLFVNKITEHISELKNQKTNYISELMKTQQHYMNICQENQIPVTSEIKDFVNRRIAEMYTKLGNAVVQSVQKLTYPAIAPPQYNNVQKTNSPQIIRAASILYRQIISMLSNGLRLITAQFGNVYTDSIKEQERKKKQEGAIQQK